MMDPSFQKSTRSRNSSASRRPRSRMPSASAYMATAAGAAAALFFVLWWILQGEDNPWVPAGLAASVVMLVAASAREVVVRRAWTRHILEQNSRARHGQSGVRQSRKPLNMQSDSLQGAALRALQKQSAEADGNDSAPEAH